MESSSRLSSSSRVLCDMTEAGVWYPSACIMGGCAGVWAPLLAKVPPPGGPPLQVPCSGAKGLPLVTERGLLGAERPEESTARFSVSSRMMVLVPCKGGGPGCEAVTMLQVRTWLTTCQAQQQLTLPCQLMYPALSAPEPCRNNAPWGHTLHQGGGAGGGLIQGGRL